MLAVSPLRSTYKDEREEENIDRFSIAGGDHQEEFSCGSLLDSIDFDDIFIGIEDGDVLPDLEIDSSDMLADYSVSNGEDSSDNQLIINVSTLSTASDENNNKENDKRRKKEEEEEEEDGRGERGNCTSGSSTSWNLSSSSVQAGGSDQEIVSKREEVVHDSVAKEESDNNDNDNNNNKGRKSSGNNLNKGSQGKRKVKVDWTPELHRRFVQVVEQLGMDKAVPSRILELMGIDCLTRHNIASHLQKYRSHQKHLRAREAEAASWNQRRQMYGGGGGKRGDMNPWLAPTMGFPHHPPPPPPPPPPTSLQPFRPLHVWGHPTHVHDHHQPLMHMWPKHLAHHHHSGPSPPPRLPWMPPPPPLAQPPPPPPDPSYWHLHHQRVPNALTPGTPCFPQTLATRFPVAPVPGIPQHGMYKVEQSIGVPTGQSDFQPQFDHFHPSKESIDAAIGDVLSKPWLPLPLGLKPPSLDSVMVELQRQGIPKIPPSAA